MIKALKKRFIFSAMLAVGILLAVLLGAINVGNVLLSERQPIPKCRRFILPFGSERIIRLSE